MQAVQLIIQGDLSTGVVSITGPVQDLRLVHWLLCEARRLCEREANKRQDAIDNGKPNLVVVRDLPQA